MTDRAVKHLNTARDRLAPNPRASDPLAFSEEAVQRILGDRTIRQIPVTVEFSNRR